nr:7-deoxyloganetin glucosyltransferase [Quercus suber]
MTKFLAPFSDVLVKLNSPTLDSPSVTCIVSNDFMLFTIIATQEFKIPIVKFFTNFACSVMGYLQLPSLKDKGIIPLIERAPSASGIIVHTFDELEQEVLHALSSMFPHVYAIGPLEPQLNHLSNDHLESIGYGLWKEETECLNWLNSKAPNLVIYVSFGSTAVMTPSQLVEIGWRLANNQQMNYKYTCNEWATGMEIDFDVKREEVEKIVRELL